MTTEANEDNKPLLCSSCFFDEGLRIDAFKHGLEIDGECPSCRKVDARKLSKELIFGLAWRFFVGGTTLRCDYGAAPVIQFNEHHYGKSTIAPSPWLVNDIKLIEDAIQIGFFHYGPRLWMVGEVEPLKSLQEPTESSSIIDRILREYPERQLTSDASFYRSSLPPTS